MAQKNTWTISGLKSKIHSNYPLAKKTWLGVGGPAQYYIEPDSFDDLTMVLQNKGKLPVTILGAGSNVLIRDGGIDGIVIHLGKNLAHYTIKKQTITCEAGLSLMELARLAQQNGIGGFEFMCGIPGNLGGGLKMNAGAYGSDMSKLVAQIKAMDTVGKIHTIGPNKKEFFSYRHSRLPKGWIFIEATLIGVKADKKQIQQTMDALREKRIQSQPQGVRTAGSTFKNPTTAPAWKLIDEAGLRGYTKNGAKMSEKHSNFMINAGSATAADLENLGEFVRHEVKKKTGQTLQWEIERMGKDG
ncbi:MAG: UDP-N-acetylmuramate dehydrogenase [Alphaproteobacteria bacterium]|nr:UDP-N-acetylmuramate dehydrogenase [Alphaproteobacteria bacterium]